VGKLIDAEFGGRNAHDRYCTACDVRFPRGSTMCPRCGGALILWARHAVVDQRKQRHQRWAAIGGLALAALLVILALVLRVAT
jgi:hypothetical protein